MSESQQTIILGSLEDFFREHNFTNHDTILAILKMASSMNAREVNNGIFQIKDNKPVVRHIIFRTGGGESFTNAELQDFLRHLEAQGKSSLDSLTSNCKSAAMEGKPASEEMLELLAKAQVALENKTGLASERKAMQRLLADTCKKLLEEEEQSKRDADLRGQNFEERFSGHVNRSARQQNRIKEPSSVRSS
jgi:hypothetical protein